MRRHKQATDPNKSSVSVEKKRKRKRKRKKKCEFGSKNLDFKT